MRVVNSELKPEFPDTFISSEDAFEPCYLNDEDRIQQRLRRLLRENGLDPNPLNINLNDKREIARRSALYEQARREILGDKYQGPSVVTWYVIFDNIFNGLLRPFAPNIK